MARFHHLEVYQLSYRFSRMMYQTKIKLPKSMKNDLGQKVGRLGKRFRLDCI